MTQDEPILVHRLIEPRKPGEAELHPGVILLHGRGADEEDLAGLTGYLDPRLTVVSPRAPFRFEFGGGYTWYDMDDIGAPAPDMFQNSYERLTRFIHHSITSYRIDPQQLFLLGFSMGTMMAYAVALTMPRLFRGVVGNSGFIPRVEGAPLQWNELSGTSFFIAHGTFDPVIPVALGRKTRDLFKESNAEWIYREYPIGHEISQESLQDQSSWITQLINGRNC